MSKQSELTAVERQVFGVDAQRDPATGRVYESGSGAHPFAVQAMIFAQEAALGRPLSGFEVVRFLQEDIAKQAQAAAAAVTAKLEAAEGPL